MLEDQWQATITHGGELPEPLLFERVDDEWSFVETHRHLILATDCWLRRVVKGERPSVHPYGLAGSWLTDPASWGLDPAANQSRRRIALRCGGKTTWPRYEQTIAATTEAELQRECLPPATPGHPSSPHTVLNCLHVILNEEWEHHRYAVRDLDILASREV